jgi:hypothetical protein
MSGAPSSTLESHFGQSPHPEVYWLLKYTCRRHVYPSLSLP